MKVFKSGCALLLAGMAGIAAADVAVDPAATPRVIVDPAET